VRLPDERLEICLTEGVPIVSFFWGQAGSGVERIDLS
jgi:hypothetical protein